MSIGRNELALRERVARLSIWKGPVEPVRLSGGITNINFFVDDRGSRFVVRVGDDIPIHQIMRFNERAASRAAFAAGISPEVVHDGENGLLVPPRDREALTAALRRITDDGELRARLAEAAAPSVAPLAEDVLLTRVVERLESVVRG